LKSRTVYENEEDASRENMTLWSGDEKERI
jgi:hypothetical protein